MVGFCMGPPAAPSCTHPATRRTPGVRGPPDRHERADAVRFGAVTGARIKGGALREFMLWYDRTHGLERVVERLALLSEEERAGLALDRPVLGILASRWYPAEMVHVLLDVVTDGADEVEKDRIAREGTRAATDQAIRGLYKLVFERLGTPERYAKNIGRLWSMLHDTGERSIEIVRDGHALSVVESWDGHHPFLCRITVETMAALFEKMGCRDVSTTQTACVSWGDPRCEATVRWRAR